MRNRHEEFIQPAEGIELVSYAPGTRVPPAPTLTGREFATIVRRIRPIFGNVASRFDRAKYPLDVYEQALAAFARPTAVSADALRNALLWKYGHLNKSGRIPISQQRLIADVQRAWPRVAKGLPDIPEQAFVEIDRQCGGRTRFITVAFLSHLAFPKQVPIIDQHNFRAVNSLLHDARPMCLGRKRPTTWTDIVVVGEFMDGVLSAWSGQSPTSVPTRQALDHFLMMFGKLLKSRHNNGLQPMAPGDI
jgi:hypothetical protein